MQDSEHYVVAREPGAEHPAIPTWASRRPNPAEIRDTADDPVERIDIESVPGAFQLTNVLSADECERLVKLTESLGYLEDAAVSLPRSIRHNHNATWIADDLTLERIWQRCQAAVTDDNNVFLGKKALGFNARFRFYRYDSGDYFAPHTDGSWPGSKVIGGELVTNAYNDRWSLLSVLFFLSDDFDGGATRFFVSESDPTLPARSNHDVKTVDIRTPLGGVLCFPHGDHPLHCLHSSEPIASGRKYIIRSDMLFQS
jgi:hypothetical protein